MVKRIALIAAGVLFILFSVIFGFQSCSYGSKYGEEFLSDDYKKTEDELFMIRRYETHSGHYQDPTQRFDVEITKKGIHESTKSEVEIPIFVSKREVIKDITVQDVIDSESASDAKKYYINDFIYYIPFSYYDYIDKYTYSADKGYSIYLGKNYPEDLDVSWDNLKIINANTRSYELCSREYENDSNSRLQPIKYNVYLADGNVGYVAFNQAARDTEARLAAKNFFIENIGYIILTVIHVIMLFILIRYIVKHIKNEIVSNKIMAAVMFALSIGFQIYGMITGSMDSPYLFGSTLLSVFAFLSLIWVGEGYLLKSFGCLAAAIIEYIVYLIIYSSSAIAELPAYHMGAIFALCAFVGMYILMFTVIEDRCQFPEAECIWQWILFALLCVICIFSFIIGAFWVALMAQMITLVMIIGFLSLGGGAGYVIYIVFIE